MLPQSGVYVVDDDQAALDALVRLISVGGYRVSGFHTATEFLQSGAFRQPGCLLLDFCLPDMSGIELQEHLNAEKSTVPVIFMSGYGDVAATVRAMKLGAVDFLTKPVVDSVLFTAIGNALALDEARRGQLSRDDDVKSRFMTLTRREQDVLNGVLLGRLNKQIARELGISEKTVKVHRGRVMAKMGVRHVAQLAQLAAQVNYRVPDPRPQRAPRVVQVSAWRRRALPGAA